MREQIFRSQALVSKQLLLEGDTTAKTLELANNALGFASGLANEALKRNPEELACRKGCSYCCSLQVEASAPEIINVAMHIQREFTDDQKEQVVQAIDQHVKATDGMSRQRRKVSRVPCPLLRNSECSVYEVRPITCRIWHSFNVDDCQKDYENPQSKNVARVDEFVYWVGCEVNLGLHVALRGERLDHRVLDFVRGLRLVLENPSLADNWRQHPRAFDAADMSKVYPDVETDKAWKKTFDNRYREATNHPSWKQVTPRET